MPIEINTSGVPAEKQSDPRFLTLRAQLQAALNNPKWRAAFCIHEAGHKIYMSRIGITKFEFFGPRIIYDESRNDFDGFPASVKAEPVPITGNGFDFDAWLLKLALTQAAGGVFARTLTAAPDDGDEGDWEKFQAGCDLIRGKMPSKNIDEKAIWKQAQDTILKDLRSPAFRKECWKEANAISQQLFGIPL